MIVFKYSSYGDLFKKIHSGEINIGNLYYEGFPLRNYFRSQYSIHSTSTSYSENAWYYYYIDVHRNDGSLKKYIYLDPNSSIDFDNEGEPLSRSHINDPEIY